MGVGDGGSEVRWRGGVAGGLLGSELGWLTLEPATSPRLGTSISRAIGRWFGLDRKAELVKEELAFARRMAAFGPRLTTA